MVLITRKKKVYPITRKYREEDDDYQEEFTPQPHSPSSRPRPMPRPMPGPMPRHRIDRWPYHRPYYNYTYSSYPPYPYYDYPPPTTIIKEVPVIPTVMPSLAPSTEKITPPQPTINKEPPPKMVADTKETSTDTPSRDKDNLKLIAGVAIVVAVIALLIAITKKDS